MTGPWEKYAKPKVSGFEAAFPRTAEGGHGIVAGPVLDLASLPGRFVAGAASAPAGPMSDPQDIYRGMMETHGKSLGGTILRDPATLPMMALGGPAANLAKEAGLTGLRALSAAGGVEGLISAGIHQSERMGEGKPFSPIQAGAETALGAAIPAAGVGVSRALGKGLSTLSGASEEALRKFGSGFSKGAEEIKAAAGKQNEIGQKLAHAIDNAYDYMPEKQVVDDALKNMPEVDISKTISILDQKAKALENPSIGKPLEPEAKAAKEIRKVIASIRGSNSTKFQKTLHPASEVRNLRKRLDLQLDDAMGADVKDVVDKALIAGRTQLKNDLIDAAKASGNDQYVQAMKTWSDKLQKVDEIKGILGGNKVTRNQRAESFVSNLFGKNKTERQKLVKQLGDIFGEDFLSEAKNAKLASEFGDEGVPSWMPNKLNAGMGAVPGASLALYSHNPAYLPLAAAGATASSPRAAAGILEASDMLAPAAKVAGRGVMRSLGQRNK